MFTLARLKLTLWYLLILMIVSSTFSLVIYRGVVVELERGYYRNVQRMQIGGPFGIHIPISDEVQELLLTDLNESRKRVLYWLLGINIFILSLSTIASYLLARKTLRPIELALEEQKRFVSDASHELHTPLTALKTSIEVALREKKLSGNAARRVLMDSLEEVDELAQLNEHLLSLSRFERNGHSLTLFRTDLADVIHTVAKRLTPLAAEKKITLSISTENEVVYADEISLAKLLTILVDNAIKYTPMHGNVTIASKQKKKHVEITVVDTGVGISKDDLPHIFDRFYRVDDARTKKDTPGFGLGLSIAQRIVTLHNGNISVSSQLGKGTTFTVSLPS